jgi:UDP-N-acetyl-D-mannosaminuronate dehydrogenase
MFKEADSAAVCLECRSTTAGLAESDCVVIATDPDALDPGLGRRHAKLIVDARRVHVGSDANIIKAQKQT